MFSASIEFTNDIMWGNILVYMLLAAGALFSWRLKLIQIVRFREMIQTLARPAKADPDGISPFQALCTSLAARVGTGNVAGVAVALYLGGPGATFWMWVVALLGMATAFAESSLAQLFKVRDADGRYRGGPAFYMARGLNAPRAAWVFSLCLIFTFGLIFNAVQSNSIAIAMHDAFGIRKVWSGSVLTLMAGVVVFGGIAGVARFAERVVPVVAGAYMAVALVVLAINASQVPEMLHLIVASAFGLDQAAGGFAGAMAAAMMNGVKRGLFSNEAGMGSAPNIAAAATPNPHHPCSQGFVQAFGVFVDTILICTATALVILLSGKLEPGSGLTGIQLTQHAMNVHLGAWGPAFIGIAILFFAFTSIAGNYAYAEGALIFLRCDVPLARALLRFGVMGMVMWGAVAHVAIVFELADLSMGLMAFINIIAIVCLSGIVMRLTRDYLARRDAGLEPEFDPAMFPDLRGKLDATIWLTAARAPATPQLDGCGCAEEGHAVARR